jgi:hypothetical protein
VSPTDITYRLLAQSDGIRVMTAVLALRSLRCRRCTHKSRRRRPATGYHHNTEFITQALPIANDETPGLGSVK